jgi:DNA-binding response OmpR family regulator
VRAESEDPDPSLTDGREVVLVIEDEAPVRRTVEQILGMSGYFVLTAEDGQAGLELAASSKQSIDLVLTDFVMPRLGGLDLIAKLRERKPDIKILLMSGFSDGQLGHDKLAALGGVETIEKPFRAATLLERVRQLLDG